jgi:hypothetical protein
MFHSVSILINTTSCLLEIVGDKVREVKPPSYPAPFHRAAGGLDTNSTVVDAIIVVRLPDNLTGASECL